MHRDVFLSGGQGHSVFGQGSEWARIMKLFVVHVAQCTSEWFAFPALLNPMTHSLDGRCCSAARCTASQESREGRCSHLLSRFFGSLPLSKAVPPPRKPRLRCQVTVHVDEKPGLHDKMSFPPPLSTKVQEAHWPSEAPTAPLSCVTADGSGTGQGSSVSGIRPEDKVAQGSEKPRPKSMVSKVLPVGRKLKKAHKRRSSLSQKRPSSASVVGHSRSATYGRGFMMPERIPSPECSPINSELSRSHLEGDDEELVLSDEGGAFWDGDMVEGLKWGDSVRFKMPDEGQVGSPKDMV